MRSEARECVFKILYSRLFNNDQPDDFEDKIYVESGITNDDRNFALSLLSTIKNNKEEIEKIIENNAIGFSFDRIYSTDKCAMMIAVCEMKYFDTIPLIVSINEGMELVRKFSTEDSPNFVNGILAKVKQQLEEPNGNS